MINWIALALIFSFIRTGFTMLNEWAKLPGTVMLVWRGFWPFVFMTPVMWLIEMPDQPLFYLFVAINAVFAGITDAYNFESSARYGGGVTLRLQPISLVVVFLMWLLISTEQRSLVMSHPYHMAGILGCLALGAYALSHLRHCEISRSAFLFLIPVIVASPFVDIFNKLSMDTVGTWHAVVTYIWCQSGLMTVMGIAFLAMKQKAHLKAVSQVSQQHLAFGCAMGAILVCAGLSKNSSMMLTPNPAYVAAIAMVSPLWATLLYKVLGKKEEANVVMGLLFVFFVTLMLLIAGLIPQAE